MMRIEDPELRRIANWYPSNREASEAIERLRERAERASTQEQRANAETSIAQLSRIIELRSRMNQNTDRRTRVTTGAETARIGERVVGRCYVTQEEYSVRWLDWQPPAENHERAARMVLGQRRLLFTSAGDNHYLWLVESE